MSTPATSEFPIPGRDCLYYAAKLRGVLFFGMVFLIAGIASPQQPDEASVIRAEGTANGSGPRVRHEAHQDALAEAIYLWVDSTVGGLTRKQLAPLFEFRERYIQTSRLLNQHRNKDGLEVEAEVYLNVEALRFDLARLLSSLLDYTPRVLILVEEQHLDDQRPTVRSDGLVVEQMSKIFQEEGFEVVGMEALLSEYESVELQGILGEGADGMSGLARENLADIAVFGTASTRRIPQERGTDTVVRLGASVELRTIGAHDGHVSEWLSAEAELDAGDTISGMRFVLEDAAYKIQRHMLVASILTAYTQERRPAIMLTVEDVPSVEWARRIRRAVARVEGVKGAELLRSRSGKVVLALDYDGHVARLVDSLEVLALQARHLELSSALPDDLHFKLVRFEEVGSPL